MQTEVRGHLLLINNKDFLPHTRMKTRKGSDVDADAMKSLFEELGFIVSDFKNLTTDQMRSELKKAAFKNYSSLGCSVCCILSHGSEGVLYGTDAAISIQEVTSYFHGRNLAGKPKLFIFQACQGY